MSGGSSASNRRHRPGRGKHDRLQRPRRGLRAPGRSALPAGKSHLRQPADRSRRRRVSRHRWLDTQRRRRDRQHPELPHDSVRGLRKLHHCTVQVFADVPCSSEFRPVDRGARRRGHHRRLRRRASLLPARTRCCRDQMAVFLLKRDRTARRTFRPPASRRSSRTCRAPSNFAPTGSTSSTREQSRPAAAAATTARRSRPTAGRWPRSSSRRSACTRAGRADRRQRAAASSRRASRARGSAAPRCFS